jgi:Cys-tRNA(Pro)/Cys-tRNA(Cys) deacylase
MKTNAARVLDGLRIRYEVRQYEFDPDDLAAGHLIEGTARGIGLPIEQIFKTLVVRGERRGVMLAVVPGDAELDFKALARLSGDRSVEMAALKDVPALTGYVRGAVTALACKKRYPVYADEHITSHPIIAVSAGVRGVQLVLAPADYLRATGATVGQIARREQQDASSG